MAALSLAGCFAQNDDISAETRNIIARCSAGIGMTYGARFEAEIAQLRTGGTLSAEAEQRIRGVIFEGANLSSDSAAQSFGRYIDCVTGDISQSQYAAFLEGRRDEVLDRLTELDITDADIAEVTDLMDRHIEASFAGNLSAAHDLHRRITQQLDEIYAEHGEADEPFFDDPPAP